MTERTEDSKVLIKKVLFIKEAAVAEEQKERREQKKNKNVLVKMRQK